MPKKLLILDVDETLIHGIEGPHASADFVVGPFSITKRPGLDEFIETVAGAYDLAVWSSGTPGYVHAVVGQLLKSQTLVFAWDVRRCTPRLDYELQERYFLKDLKKVARRGYNLDHVLIVEDDPRAVARHYGNAIYVRAFEGDSDDELPQLARYLLTLADLENVRDVEKRGWRSSAEGTGSS